MLNMPKPVCHKMLQHFHPHKKSLNNLHTFVRYYVNPLKKILGNARKSTPPITDPAIYLSVKAVARGRQVKQMSTNYQRNSISTPGKRPANAKPVAMMDKAGKTTAGERFEGRPMRFSAWPIEYDTTEVLAKVNVGHWIGSRHPEYDRCECARVSSVLHIEHYTRIPIRKVRVGAIV